MGRYKFTSEKCVPLSTSRFEWHSVSWEEGSDSFGLRCDRLGRNYKMRDVFSDRIEANILEVLQRSRSAGSLQIIAARWWAG